MALSNIVFAGLFDNPSVVWIWIIIVPVVGGLGLGLISTLLNHQKSMAQIMRGHGDDGTAAEIAALRQEVQELKAMMQQALSVGAYQASVPEPQRPPLHVTTRE